MIRPSRPRERWWACTYKWAIEPPSALPEYWRPLPELGEESKREFWLYSEGYYQDELASEHDIELREWNGTSMNLVRNIGGMIS